MRVGMLSLGSSLLKLHMLCEQGGACPSACRLWQHSTVRDATRQITAQQVKTRMARIEGGGPGRLTLCCKLCTAGSGP